MKKLLTYYKNLPYGVKAGLWFTFCNFILKGISFITMPIFTRIMSKSAYGDYSTYTSWYNFLLIFTSLHLSYYVFSKGMVKFEEDRDEFVISLQSLSTITTIVFFALYFFYHKQIDKYTGLEFPLMLCMFLHLFFIPSIEYWTARKRFEYDYVKVVFVSITVALLDPAIGIALIKLFKDAVLARALSAAAVVCCFGIFLYVSILHKGKKLFSIKYWKYALAFNIPLIPHFLSTTVLSQADRIMITKMLGSEQTALYSVAYALGMITLLFSQAIQQAMLPWQYTKLKRKQYDDLTRIPTATLVFLAGIISLLMSFAPELLWIVAPTSYQAAVWAIPPVCGAVFFMYLFNIFANIEYYFEETKYVAIASIAAAGLNILLNWLFIPVFGYTAAGYTTLFCYIMLALCHFVCMKIICKKHSFNIRIYDEKAILVISASILFLNFLLMFLYRSTVLRYIFIFAIIIVAYIKRRLLVDIYRMFKSKKE